MEQSNQLNTGPESTLPAVSAVKRQFESRVTAVASISAHICHLLTSGKQQEVFSALSFLSALKQLSEVSLETMLVDFYASSYEISAYLKRHFIVYCEFAAKTAMDDLSKIAQSNPSLALQSHGWSFALTKQFVSDLGDIATAWLIVACEGTGSAEVPSWNVPINPHEFQFMSVKDLEVHEFAKYCERRTEWLAPAYLLSNDESGRLDSEATAQFLAAWEKAFISGVMRGATNWHDQVVIEAAKSRTQAVDQPGPESSRTDAQIDEKSEQEAIFRQSTERPSKRKGKRPTAARDKEVIKKFKAKLDSDKRQGQYRTNVVILKGLLKELKETYPSLTLARAGRIVKGIRQGAK